jgi:hypothetical protein
MTSLAFAEEKGMAPNSSTKLFQLDEVTVTEQEMKDEIETPNKVTILPELLLQGRGETMFSLG